ncbi:MAG: hypothetical protein ABJN57_07625 [Hyphomicrobiales bacterium]
MVKSSTSLEKIVLNIYEAAQSPEQWQDVAKLCSNNFLLGTFEIVCFDKTSANPIITIMDNASIDVQKEYLSSYIQDDKRTQYLWENEINKPVPFYQLSEDPRLKDNHDYNQFAERVDLEILTAANLTIDNQKCFFTNARSRYAPSPDNDYFKALNLLMPHMRKAIRLQLTMSTYKTNNTLLAQSWNSKNTAIFFLKTNYEVIFTNAFAEDLLSKKLYKISNNRLHFTTNKTNQLFYKSLYEISRSDQLHINNQDSFLIQDKDSNDYGVRLMPYLGDVSELNMMSTSLVMVIITPLNGSTLNSPEDVHHFGRLYGLTFAEEQILYALNNEIELSEFAKTKNIKIDTVRKQLKSVLRKTGLRSQKQLIRLIDRFCFLNLK